jgi:hypothetical protein
MLCVFVYFIRLLDFITRTDNTTSTTSLFTTVHKSKSGITVCTWSWLGGLRLKEGEELLQYISACCLFVYHVEQIGCSMN